MLEFRNFGSLARTSSYIIKIVQLHLRSRLSNQMSIASQIAMSSKQSKRIRTPSKSQLNHQARSTSPTPVCVKLRAESKTRTVSLAHRRGSRFLVDQGTGAQFVQFLQGSQANGFEAELRRVYGIDSFADLQARWVGYARSKLDNAPSTATASNTPRPETRTR